MVCGREKSAVEPGPPEGSTMIVGAALTGGLGGVAVRARRLSGSGRIVGAAVINYMAETSIGVEMVGGLASAEVDVAGQVGEPPSDARERRQIDGLGDGVETQAAHEHTSGADDHCSVTPNAAGGG
jgi:hypothetical protein